jgi:hypothetical protein
MRARRFVVTSGIAAVILAGGAMLAPRRAGAAATIVVNTTSYQDIDNSECSIYEAVIAANTNASYKGCAAVNAGVGDTITFNLSPFNRRINILITPLPAITEAVTIDGGIANGERVELHGGGAPPVSGRHGITVTPTGFGTIIRNLVINNFADDGIFINADEVWVFGCRIGTDVTGTMAMPNQGFGIQVFGGNGNRIGSGMRTGSACDVDCNLISGATNLKANVLLDLNSLNALVRGNYIGTDVTGTVGITPQDVQGIVDKGSGNQIGGLGGTTPGGPCTGDCNLISATTSTAASCSTKRRTFPWCWATSSAPTSPARRRSATASRPATRWASSATPTARRSAAPRRRRATWFPATSAPASRCAASAAWCAATTSAPTPPARSRCRTADRA